MTSDPTPNASDKAPASPPDGLASMPTSRAWHWWLRKLITPALILAAGALVIFGLGIAQRIGWLTATDVAVSDSSSEAEEVYTCPMHPQIRQPTPGRCPICGMALVVAASAGADLDAFSVKIEPAQRRLANIQTAKAKREPLVDEIETVGAIAIDESRMATIASYIKGRLERLFADYTGIDVAKGDHLAVIYSPELYAAQVEYIEIRRSYAAMGQATLAAVREAQQRLVTNSRQRLVELGMTEAQITALEQGGKAKSRLTIFSPIGGTVIEKPAVEGKYVDAGEPIYRIADLSTVWLMLELYPEDAARIRFGQLVEAEIQSIPGEKFQGRVAFIDPTVDPEKRTVGVRVEFLNDDKRLRPGDYATATIAVPIGQTGDVYDADLAGRWISPMHPQIIRDEPGQCPICGMDLVPTSRYGYSEKPVEQPSSLFVPRSALLMAGNNSVVYVEVEPGRFEIRPVTIGPILREVVIILDGLNEGEDVATAGNFLIDSQMQLAGKPSLIDPTRAVAAKRKPEGPLQFEHIHVTPVPGDVGRDVESFYRAYFAIQDALANDQKPPTEAATLLHQLAKDLGANGELTKPHRELLQEVAGASEHLHHMELADAREAFKSISHAVVTLATELRGSDASEEFVHFFCPHVKGGGGDWLQPNDQLFNPYYGSEMPRCGNQVHVFPTKGHLDQAEPGESTESTEHTAE